MKDKLYLKFVGIITGIITLVAIFFRLVGMQNILSDIYFLLGMILVCLAIINILLYASLLSGWFRKKEKGESDDQYAKRKIDIHNVASRKNQPIHFEKFAVNSLCLGLVAIILAILMTL